MICFGILRAFMVQVFWSIKEWFCPENEDQFLSVPESDEISQLIENFELSANRGVSRVSQSCTYGGVTQKVRTKGNYRRVDLHNMKFKEAMDEVLNQLKSAKQDKCRTLIIITGQGNHSEGGKPKIKPAVIRLLKKERAKNGRTEEKLVHKFQQHSINAGVQVVRIFRDL